MIRQFIRKQILGYSLPQEYACLALEDLIDPLGVALTVKGSCTSLDVSTTHLFLGYKPLIIGIPVDTLSEFYSHLNSDDEICLSFHEKGSESSTNWRGFPTFKESIARIILRKTHSLKCGDNTLFVFEGKYAKHEFIGNINQFINRQREKRRIDRKVNINLSDNLGDQVQAAYSIPRIISIVTLVDNGKMNMFPTDLHGAVGNKFYVGSLRHGGKANEQVEKLKRIAVSRIDVTWCKQAYSLGKNHMQELKDINCFSTNTTRSSNFNIPLPEAVNFYHELEQVNSIDLGIHRIHSYGVVNTLKMTNAKTLSHIHRFYAQWRLNNGKSTKFYWR